METMKIKTIIMAVGLLLASASAFAQEETASAPHWYVGVQGGAQVMPIDGKIGDLWTPHFGIQAGRQVTDVFGMRIQALGYQSKGEYSALSAFNEPGAIAEYNVLSAKWDLLFNVMQILAPNRLNKSFNWNLFMGAGATGLWGTPDYSDKVVLYPGVGTQLEYLFGKKFSINLELQANHKALVINEIEPGNHWQAVALLGLTYHFGHKKAKKAEPVVVEPVYATRVDTVWYNDTEYKTVEAPEQITRNIHYAIRQSAPVDPTMVKEIADFVKSHKDAKVVVTGYADKGTGNAKLNMKYSEERAVAVADAIKAAGVSADIITVEWKGDTVQPFAENDQNRVAITVASGIGEKKEPVQVKKYRTEQVRYEVK